MTGLFDRIKNAKLTLVKPDIDKIQLSPLQELDVITESGGAKEVNGDLSLTQTDVPKPFQLVDLGETDDIQFGGEKTPTDAILEMAGDGTDFAVKGVVRSPNAFTAAQVQANYNESLGFGSVAEILRKCCEWQYKHNSSDKGERAKLIFGALGTAKQEEFQLEKETKGLLGKK